MTEPDVTLTDYLLAAEAALFFVLLQRGNVGSARLRTWFSLFFASGLVASLCGGTVHGFLLEPGWGQSALWLITLLAMGVAASRPGLLAPNCCFPVPRPTGFGGRRSLSGSSTLPSC